MSIFSPASWASPGECTSVVTGIFSSRPIAAKISQPSRAPVPRKERSEVRFALSYELLKIRSTSSAAQISAILRAIRQTNFSDSITHGPRINPGRLPANRDFANPQRLPFSHDLSGKQERRNFKGFLPAFLLSSEICLLRDRQSRTARRARERTATPRRAFAGGKAGVSRREN